MVLGRIVWDCQAAFVLGQQIHNHILLAYEMVKGYTKKVGSHEYTLQLDLQKAYDLVDWRALKCILQQFGLPHQFITWIMLTMTRVSYKFNINREYSH